MPTLLTLADYLDRLLSWCDSSDKPPHTEIRILDTRDERVRYLSDQESGNGWNCPPAALQSPEDYADQFDTLQRSGYSWINLSLLGMLEQVLIVSVEVSSGGPVGAPAGKTSINYSRPRLDPKRGERNWRANVTLSEDTAPPT